MVGPATFRLRRACSLSACLLPAADDGAVARQFPVAIYSSTIPAPSPSAGKQSKVAMLLRPSQIPHPEISACCWCSESVPPRSRRPSSPTSPCCRIPISHRHITLRCAVGRPGPTATRRPPATAAGPPTNKCHQPTSTALTRLAGLINHKIADCAEVVLPVSCRTRTAASMGSDWLPLCSPG